MRGVPRGRHAGGSVTKTTTRLALWATLLLVAIAPAVRGEEVEKKWRVGFALGGAETRQTIDSDAGNVLAIVNSDGLLVDVIRDPRNDSGALGSFSIRPAYRATLKGQYAITRKFILQGSVGYQRGDVGNVEMQAQFPDQQIPANTQFNFRTWDITAGKMQQIPVELTAMVRFRPKSAFNPYIGTGLGYMFVSFKPSEDLNVLSQNMSRSQGGLATIISNQGIQTLTTTTDVHDLGGATVDAPSSWTWHAVAGIEYTVKKNWSLFAELRYMWAKDAFTLLFNGSPTLGLSVPAGTQFDTAPKNFGPMFISQGGLIDAGRPGTVYNPITGNNDAAFIFQPDGVLDPGWYYVTGGKIRYDGGSFEFGFKYTF